MASTCSGSSARPSGATVVYDVDPETSAWQRFQVGFLAGLPIDWLL